MSAKTFARSLAKKTFDAMPPLYCTTMSAGARLLRKSPMSRAWQIQDRPYSTLLKFLEMGREQNADKKARKRLYEELRLQLVRLRDCTQDIEEKRLANRTLNRLERDEQETRLLSYPVRGYIELTNYCNLRCQMCGQAYFDDHGGKRKHLAKEAYNKFVEQLPYLDETVATGFGESLLSPYFWDLMEILPWGGIKRLITNGILLDSETTRRLLKYPLNEYFISFEATDRETYKFVRSGDHLDKVLQNIRDMDKNRQEAGREDITIQLGFVAMKRNIEQLPGFVRQAREIGADRVVVSFLHVTRPHLIEQSLYFEPELANKNFLEAKKVAEKLGIEYFYPENFEPRESDPNKSRRIRDCYEPWEFIYFESNGQVRPCCIYPKPMGNILQTDYQTIWNNETYQSLRKTVNSEHPEEYCAKCFYMGHVDHNDRHFHIGLTDKRGVSIPEDKIDEGVWE
jgi:radical SAM protein with 4Fe4S-binding SPASM domain